MILTTYNSIDKVQWKNLVDCSAVATWFQTEEAYNFYASMPAIMQPFIFAVKSGEQLKGIIIGYITQADSKLKQYFTRRAIIIGGPLLANDITDNELNELLQTTYKQLARKAIYIETRNFNDYSRWKNAFEKNGFTYKPHLNFHVDTGSMDIVNSHLGKNRKRDIRVSFRDGADIIVNPTLNQVKVYYSILKQLYTTKVKTPLFEWEFFEKLFSLPSAHFLLVEFQEQIIGGTVCVELAGRTLYEWFVCGKDGKYKNIFPSEVATFAGLQYATEHSCTRFDMMGAGTPEEAYGVRDFKARFGGELVEHGRFIRINNSTLYQLGSLGVKLLKINRGGVIVDYQPYSLIIIYHKDIIIIADNGVFACIYTSNIYVKN